jgi:hypothetical protein
MTGGRHAELPGPARLRQQNAALAKDDDPVPADIDEFRRALARKIMTRLGMAERCRDHHCRRHRKCSGPDLRCQRDFPAPPMTPAETAAMPAHVQKLLRERREEDGDV